MLGGCRPRDHHHPLFQPQPGRGPQTGLAPKAGPAPPQVGPPPQDGTAPQAKELPHPRPHTGRGPTATWTRGPARQTRRPLNQTQRACWIFEVCPTTAFAFGIPFVIAEAAAEVRATPPSATATTAILSLMGATSLFRPQNALLAKWLLKGASAALQFYVAEVPLSSLSLRYAVLGRPPLGQ
jgi:hypothetical protein